MAGTVVLRELEVTDCAVIAEAFRAQGWEKPAEQYQRYLAERQAGARDVIVAEADGLFAGYLTIVWESSHDAFREAGIPEIVDFNVLLRFRRQGIGTRLMESAEQRIAQRSPRAGLGTVPLPDYGPAHMLYSKRGYLPDGRGLFQHGRQLAYGDQATVDDSLVMYFVKQLST
jgi:GNAT superfamily N-acetyltransferase